MRKKIFAISSSGGHWEQLMVIKEGFGQSDVLYVNTLDGLAERNGISDALVVPDCNRDMPIQCVKVLVKILNILVRYRPDLIVSTGAAPGLIAIGLGRVLGSRTIWVDSIANSEQISMSGKVASYIAHTCLTQWKHLEDPGRVLYKGSVL